MKVMERMETSLDFRVEEATAALLERLRGSLAERKVTAWLVGGFVRDGLLGKDSQDIDVVVEGPALNIARELADDWDASFVLMDEENQVARVVLPESKTHLDFSAMRGDLEHDLSLRDFTVDAIALGMEQVHGGCFRVQPIDPFHGLSDVQARRIKAVTDAAFADDPLRLMRAVRLARQLDFDIEPATEALIHRDHALISSVSGERVRDELFMILAQPGAGASLRWLDRLGLLCTVIPELTPARGSEQPKEHYWDVFEHSIETVSAVECVLRAAPCEPDVLKHVPWSDDLAARFSEEVSAGRSRQTLLKLAALLHDIAKPQTKSFEPSGRMRFFGHGPEGAITAQAVMERLRFSRREITMVSVMVEHHLRPGQLVDETMPTQRAIYRYFRDTGEVGVDTVFLNLADHLAARGPSLEIEEWTGHARVAAYMLEKHSLQQTVMAPPRLIDGRDIMETFRLGPGPEIGRLLEAVREAQAVGEIASREQALALVKQRLAHPAKDNPRTTKERTDSI